MHHWLTMLQDASHMFLFLAFELSILFLLISAGVSLIRQNCPTAKSNPCWVPNEVKAMLSLHYWAH